MLYKIAAAILKPALHLYYNIKVADFPDPFPEGKLIISGNHTCWVDPAWLSTVVPRQIHYLAKEEIFNNIILRALFLNAGFYPVKRGRPDRKAIKFACDILNNGGVLGIFPEGTRNKEGIGHAFNGAAYLSLKTESPILPVTIDVSGHSVRSEINITFHEIIKAPDDKTVSKENLNNLTGIVMSKISSGLK